MIRIIKLPEVLHQTGRSRSAIYRDMQKGTFRKSISLGGKSVGWRESDVQEWIEQRIKASGMEV
jgi:prophage regulatory protein